MSDAPALAALICELGYETSSAEMSQRLKSILSDPRYGTFVAEIDNEIRGMIGTLAHANITIFRERLLLWWSQESTDRVALAARLSQQRRKISRAET